MQPIDRHHVRPRHDETPQPVGACVALELLSLLAIPLVLLANDPARIAAALLYFSGGGGWLLAGIVPAAFLNFLVRTLIVAVASISLLYGVSACLFGCDSATNAIVLIAIIGSAALVVFTPIFSAATLWYYLYRTRPSP